MRGPWTARFKKVVALFDSPAERPNAVSQAMKICEENDIHFYEACEAAYGGNDEEVRQLQGQVRQKQSMVDQLQAKNVELESDNATMAAAINVLQEQVRDAQDMQDMSGGAFGKFRKKLWSYPQVRVLAILGYEAAWFAFYATLATNYPFRSTLPETCFWITAIVTGFMIASGVKEWIEAEFVKSDVGVTVVKGLILLSGTYMAMSAYMGSPNLMDWILAERNLYPALGVLLATAAVVVTNCCEEFVKALSQSNSAPLKALRSWFV